MSAVTKSASTSASPADVWEVLSGFFSIADWASAISHSSPMTAEPLGLGASRRVQAGATVLIENVLSWDPGVGLSYELVGLPPMVHRAVNEWSLVPTSTDGTEVSLTITVIPGPKPPMKLAAKVVAGRVAKTNASLVADLIARAEQESPK